MFKIKCIVLDDKYTFIFLELTNTELKFKVIDRVLEMKLKT